MCDTFLFNSTINLVMNQIFRNRSAIPHFYLLIVFCFSKCLTNLIHESELNDLYESVKHLLNYSKNISRVPQDCSDRPYVQIDIVFREDNLNSSKYFAVFANQSYYVEIDGITRDHLPIVHRDVQPMVVNSLFRRKMTGKVAISEYKFVGPLYLYKEPDIKDAYRLVGFNQVWVGCPQPLCISPGFDGILSLSSITTTEPYVHSHRSQNLLILFRGNYFWYYHFANNKTPIHPPLTDSAIRVEERWVDRNANIYAYRRPHNRHQSSQSQTQSSYSYLNDSMVVPTYIDAVVPGINKYNNCLYFFKNDNFVCYEWFSSLKIPLKIADHWKSDDIRWKISKLDGAFYSKTIIYFFAGELLWCFSGSDRIPCHSYPKNLKDLHKDFPTNITSAFQHQDYLYIIKGSVYYKMLISRFPLKVNDEDMTEQYLFQDLLGCDDSLYTAWGFHSYETFIENFGKRMQTGINSMTYANHTKFNPTFLILSLAVLAISSSIVLVLWYVKPLWMTKILQSIRTPFV